MPDLLFYTDNPFAVPSFRILAIVKGPLSAPDTRRAFDEIYALFEERYGEAASVTSYHFGKHRGKIRWLNPNLLADGKAFFDREASKYGEGIRRYGYALKAFEEPALPYFGLEDRSLVSILELALPDDDPDLTGFADAVTDQLGTVELMSGVMGFGYFLPPYHNSLRFMMGTASARYAAAIEVTPSAMLDGVMRESSAYRWPADEEPGIIDVGWRTLVGKDYLDRLSDTADVEPAVTVERKPNMTVFTVGNAPIWGDREADEDISGYITLAAHLKPVRFPKGLARIAMFGGDAPDRTDAYLARFDRP